jgi:hypothetical protein
VDVVAIFSLLQHAFDATAAVGEMVVVALLAVHLLALLDVDPLPLPVWQYVY